METLLYRRSHARNILLRMIILAIISAGIVLWKLDFLNEVYFRNQLTRTGLIINGTILALFALGILKMIGTLLHYTREESALARFMRNLKNPKKEPTSRVSSKSLIAQRFRTMTELHEAHTPINHSALAATTVAAESTRNSFPKFINNILILTGVFGTIVSLSVALLGASDLLESSVDMNGMGLVIHGMSTALSTTITAIVCYLYFGYFYIKLLDVQTNLISGLEQVTSNYLMPRFQVQTDSILYEFSGLIRSLQGLVSQMEDSQRTFGEIQKHLVNTLDSYRGRIQSVSSDMDSIKQLLRAGFRLPSDHDA